MRALRESAARAPSFKAASIDGLPDEVKREERSKKGSLSVYIKDTWLTARSGKQAR